MPNQGSPILQPGASITPGYYPGGQAAAPGSGSVSFTTPGSFSWTVPSGVTRIVCIMCGGGGGGAGSANATYYGGGGGAISIYLTFISVNPGDLLSGQVGAGGVGGSATADGGDGSPSTMTSSLFGWTISSGYGEGGTPASSTANGVGGGGPGPTSSGSPPLLISRGGLDQGGESGSVDVVSSYLALYLDGDSLYEAGGEAVNNSTSVYGTGGAGATDADTPTSGNGGVVQIVW